MMKYTPAHAWRANAWRANASRANASFSRSRNGGKKHATNRLIPCDKIIVSLCNSNAHCFVGLCRVCWEGVSGWICHVFAQSARSHMLLWYLAISSRKPTDSDSIWLIWLQMRTPFDAIIRFDRSSVRRTGLLLGEQILSFGRSHLTRLTPAFTFSGQYRNRKGYFYNRCGMG